MIYVGLLGCGTVGSGVVKVLQKNREAIARKVGEEVVLKKVLERYPENALKLGIAPEQVVSDIEDIVNDDDISIVIELIGGTKIARDFIKLAITHGKHIVTANKDLIASYGKEIFELAEQHHVDFYFEASVAGGIPILLPMKQSLAANEVSEVIGILNGTTNYILTKMSMEGSDYAEVLAEAQALGYAEADPTSDVEGLDAGRKVAILASIAFNSRVTFDDVHCEGISKIQAVDISIADQMGYVIKLLGIAKKTDGKILACVHPTFVPKDHPLATVNDVFNAVFYTGDAVGDVMFFGRGAGQLPTASSVVGDVMEISRNIRMGSVERIGCTCYEEIPMQDILEVENEFYIRMNVTDEPGVLACIAGAFGKHNVSLLSVVQEATVDEAALLVLITHSVKERNLRAALQELEGMDIVKSIGNVIRVYKK